MREIAEADAESDVSHALARRAQPPRGVTQPCGQHVAVRSLADHAAIHAQEMKRTHVGLRGEIVE